MSNRIVLVGAGSAAFGLGTLTDIFSSQVLRGSTVVLHDIDVDALHRVESIAQRYVREHDLPYTVTATTSRREALQGANFCVISIEVGDRFQLWEQDWKIPLQYGIRQVYGENGGPGGLFHSLRIIPPILEICGDIQAFCPDAQVINFSNPMSRICLTVHRKYPDLKLVGLCHEIFSLPEHLPKILDTPFDNLAVKAGGLNHFSVLLEARYRNSDLDAYPDIRAKAPAYFRDLPEFVDELEECVHPSGNPLPPSKRGWVERRLFKVILERFGYLPITSDSHFGEYVQWAHDAVDHRAILDFYDWYKRWSLDKKVAEISDEPSSERVVPIMEGILTDSHQEELAVNIPNDGLIDNLPWDLVVEVPATVDKDGVHGSPVGALPKGIAGLLNNQVAVHDLTAEAVLTGSREIALQALLVDPIVDTVRGAKQLLDTMLELQKEYLGYIR